MVDSPLIVDVRGGVARVTLNRPPLNLLRPDSIRALRESFEALARDPAIRVAVLTGEGRLDAQTLNGKVVVGVAAAAHRLGVPTMAIVGSTGPGAEQCKDPAHGDYLRGYVSLSDRYGLERALREPEPLISELAREIVAAELDRGGRAGSAGRDVSPSP